VVPVSRRRKKEKKKNRRYVRFSGGKEHRANIPSVDKRKKGGKRKRVPSVNIKVLLLERELLGALRKRANGEFYPIILTSLIEVRGKRRNLLSSITVIQARKLAWEKGLS